jgi:hypothetical protein
MPFFGDDRVMGCTRAELARWLVELAGSDGGMAESGHATLAFDWGLLVIEARPMPSRRIALLRLPQLEVCFRYDPAFRDQARAWITHFDHHTQRGGG